MRISIFKSTMLGLVLLSCVCSCKRADTRIVARFKDGTPSLIYDFPDKRDTSTYTYLEYYSNRKIHKRIEVEANMIVRHPTIFYPEGKIYEIDSLFEPRQRYSSYWNGWIRRFSVAGNVIGEFQVKNGVIRNAKVFDSAGKL